MSEMQATIETSVEFHNFYNVDLFQRGFYQIRCYMKSSPKLPIKVEVSLPRNLIGDDMFPASIINGKAVTKTIQIMYRNEEVQLNDVVHFKIHAIVESGKIEEILEKADLTLYLELWYTETGADVLQESYSRQCSEEDGDESIVKSRRSSVNGIASPYTTIECVSMRALKLNFQPCRGLHYHLPVLFDYFHLAAVSATVHMVLTSLHQPYITFPSSSSSSVTSANGTGSLSKPKKNVTNNSRLSQPTMETILFGTNQTKSSSKGSCLDSGNRLSTARKIHREVCNLLLASLESLQLSFIQLSALLVDQQTRAQAKLTVSDCQRRLNSLSEMAKDCRMPNCRQMSSLVGKDRRSVPRSTKEISERWERSRWYLAIDTEEEFLALANNDISQLCGELVMMWNNFLSVCIRKKSIKNHLSRVHHLNRVKRFSEAFFVIQNTRSSALSCCESVYSKYQSVSSMLRCSKYLVNLPNLPVSCSALDGDVTNLPIIYEDKYQEDTTPKVSTSSVLTKSAEGFNAMENRRHSFSNLPALEDPVDHNLNDGNVNLNERIAFARTEGNGRRPPRPSSIPAAKKFTGDFGAQSNLDYVRLRQCLQANSGKESLTNLQNKALSDLQEQQLVPNHLDLEDEPSVLTSKTCMPSSNIVSELNGSKTLPSYFLKGQKNGLSHLDWNATNPYNLAEEQDLVQGMKHSHSCHSMPAPENENGQINTHLTNGTESVPNLNSKIVQSDNFSLESGCGTLDSIEEAFTNNRESNEKPLFQMTFRPGRKISSNPESTSSSDTSVSCGDESDVSRSPRVHFNDCDLGIHSFSSSPSEPANNFKTDKVASMAPLTFNNYATEKADLKDSSAIRNGSIISATVSRETQEELSKRLEEFRLKSRSTKASFVDRPRAKSEEVMSKFSGDSGFQQRCRLKSESANVREQHQNLMKKTSLPSKTDPDLSSPRLIQSLSSGQVPVSNNGRPSNPVKVALPPPVEFRDPPRGIDHSKQNGFIVTTPEANQALREKLERRTSSVSRMTSATEPATYEPPSAIGREFLNSCDDIRQQANPQPQVSSGTIPLRKRSQSKESQQVDSASLSRLDYKRSHQSPATYTPPSQSNGQNSFKRNYSKKTSHVSPPDDQSTTFQPLVPVVSEETVNFIKAKEDFKNSMNFNGTLYSEFLRFPTTVPYFHHQDDNRLSVRRNIHLVICVHGLEGNSADLRLIKIYLEMALPGHNLDFLMSEGNQGDTFSSFESMTDRLVGEILLHVSSYTFAPSRISFVGHSLGCILIRSAISRPEMAHLSTRFYTFLSLSGPHLGTLYNNSGLVNMGLWFMQKWKKSGSLHQLALKDATDIRKTFMYQLSVRSNLHLFKHVLLAGSTQDHYVPWHSARIELCKAAVKDRSVTGSAYREMVDNILSPIVSNPDLTLIRYDIHHALPSNTTNTIIGRAAHIAVLDSELFIEKFIMISAIKYFI